MVLWWLRHRRPFLPTRCWALALCHCLSGVSFGTWVQKPNSAWGCPWRLELGKSNFIKACSEHADRFQAFRNDSKLNGDTQRYFVMGQSAGGHLALALARKLVNLNRQGEVRGIAALVPIAAHPDHIPAQYVDKYRSFKDCANAPMNSARTMIEFFGLCSF